MKGHPRFALLGPGTIERVAAFAQDGGDVEAALRAHVDVRIGTIATRVGLGQRRPPRRGGRRRARAHRPRAPPAHRLRGLGLRRRHDELARAERAVPGRPRDRQDHGGRHHRARARPRPLPHRHVDENELIDPHLDIRLSHEFRATTVTSHVGGTQTRPTLDLSADPGHYDQAELLGWVLDGDPDDPAVGKRPIGDEAVGLASSMVLDQNLNEVNVEYRLGARWLLDAFFGDRGVAGADLIWSRKY